MPVPEPIRKRYTVIQSRKKLLVCVGLFFTFVCLSLLDETLRINKLCPVYGNKQQVQESNSTLLKENRLVTSRDNSASASINGYIHFKVLVYDSFDEFGSFVIEPIDEYLNFNLVKVEQIDGETLAKQLSLESPAVELLELAGVKLTHLLLYTNCVNIDLVLASAGGITKIIQVTAQVKYNLMIANRCSWSTPNMFSFSSSNSFECNNFGLVCKGSGRLINGMIYFRHLKFEIDRRTEANSTTFSKNVEFCNLSEFGRKKI